MILPIILPDPRTRRINECIEDALDDLERWKIAVETFLSLIPDFRYTDITYCDHGTGRDILALVEGFKPHSARIVEERARERAEEAESF